MMRLLMILAVVLGAMQAGCADCKPTADMQTAQVSQNWTFHRPVYVDVAGNAKSRRNGPKPNGLDWPVGQVLSGDIHELIEVLDPDDKSKVLWAILGFRPGHTASCTPKIGTYPIVQAAPALDLSGGWILAQDQSPMVETDQIVASIEEGIGAAGSDDELAGSPTFIVRVGNNGTRFFYRLRGSNAGVVALKDRSQGCSQSYILERSADDAYVEATKTDGCYAFSMRKVVPIDANDSHRKFLNHVAKMRAVLKP